jgi:hypothetical protein
MRTVEKELVLLDFLEWLEIKQYFNSPNGYYSPLEDALTPFLSSKELIEKYLNK